MARCRETRVIRVTKTDNLELACDLDEHEKILDFHFDEFHDVEWRHPLEPMGVPATRTNPPKTMKAKAARAPMDIILGRL